MGESGGRAGEPTEPRGVGGIKAIAGKISIGMSMPEENDPVVFSSVDQLAARARVLAGWRPHCYGSSVPEIDVLYVAARLTFSSSSSNLFGVKFVSRVHLMIV